MFTLIFWVIADYIQPYYCGEKTYCPFKAKRLRGKIASILLAPLLVLLLPLVLLELLLYTLLGCIVWLKDKLFIITLALFCSLVFVPKAHAYSDIAIVKAIYLAEGGKKAQYPYGIRSIKTSSKAESKHICLNTVRNQRKRHARHKCGQDFITCLGARYCPVKGRLSKSEQRVNKYWVKNVKHYLNKGG